MKQINFKITVILSFFFLSLPLSAASYFQFRAGAGITGGDSAVYGAEYNDLNIEGGDNGPSKGIYLGSSYMYSLSSSSAIVVNANSTIISSIVKTQEDTPVEMEDQWDITWHYDELNVCYSYTIAGTLTVFGGPLIMTSFGSGKYPYTGSHEGYADEFDNMGIFGGGVTGLSARIHLFQSLFFLPKAGTGFVSGVTIRRFDSDTITRNDSYTILNSSLGFGYYFTETRTMVETGAHASFYIKKFVPENFFNGIRYGRIVFYSAVTKQL